MALPFAILANTPNPPDSIWVEYSEKMLVIRWTPVEGAFGYHIYSSPIPGSSSTTKRRITRQPITSGTRYGYVWDFVGGQRIRRIKGYEHHICVTALEGEDTILIESACSPEWSNQCFEGFERRNTKGKLKAIFEKEQRVPYLPIDPVENSKRRFIRFMEGPGQLLEKEIHGRIDFLQTGSCAPLSTVLVKLLKDFGLYAYKVDGQFVREFHAFVVINLGGVEYVVDYAADQFLPDVLPVVVPRDFCYLNSRSRFDRAGKPVYMCTRIYRPEDCRLNDNEASQPFRAIYQIVSEHLSENP